MNELKEIVTERPMSFARAFHILTVWMKKDLIRHFLGTNRVSFVLLLDLVALYSHKARYNKPIRIPVRI